MNLLTYLVSTLPSLLPTELDPEAASASGGVYVHLSWPTTSSSASPSLSLLRVSRNALPAKRRSAPGSAHVIQVECVAELLSLLHEPLPAASHDGGSRREEEQDQIRCEVVRGDQVGFPAEGPSHLINLFFLESVADPSVNYQVARKDYLGERYSRLPGVVHAQCSEEWRSTKSRVGPGSFIGHVCYAPPTPKDGETRTSASSEAWRNLLARAYGDVPIESEQNMTKDLLAIIDYGSTMEIRQSWTNAAIRLGLRVVLVEKPTSVWARQWRDADKRVALQLQGFPHAVIECDMGSSSSDFLTDSLVRCIEEFQEGSGVSIQGVVAPNEGILGSATAAAVRLGLPVMGTVEGVQRCADKTAFRELFPWRGCKPRLLRCAADVEELTTWKEWPVVIKPVYGGGSQGVFRADSYEEVRLVWQKRLEAASAGQDGARYLVEPYVSGTECDLNLVYEHGELLFTEMVDEPACGDDASRGGSGSDDVLARDFLIPYDICPTQATQRAVDLVSSECIRALDKLSGSLDNGLYQPLNGVFHFEARYREASSEVFLIELNPRSPGVAHTLCSTIIHGVDEAGCYFLSALGRPLLPACAPSEEPMAWTKYSFVPERRAGRLVDDPLRRVRDRDDVLNPVAWPKCFVFDGPTSGIKYWSCAFIVVSYTSYQDCLRRADEVAGLIDAILEEV